MIAVAFVMFAVLIVAWLMAPNGEVKAAATPAPAPAPATLKMGDARA
jgi:hypothetical protein